MCSIFKYRIFCSIIISHFITIAYGSEEHLNLDNLEHFSQQMEQPQQFHRGIVRPNVPGLKFLPQAQLSHHQGPQNFNYHQLLRQQQQAHYEQGNNQNYPQFGNGQKGPLITNDHKNSIIINSQKDNTPTVPIIINHGHGHLKHLSDIIIHDQKCGSPTRIKETKHGLFGLFHKSHIIIIGKDCNHHPKIIPVFTPKMTTPIHLHQELNKHSYNHYNKANGDIDWVDDDQDAGQDADHWPDAEEHQAPIPIKYKAPVDHSSTSISHSFMTTPMPDDIQGHFEPVHDLSPSKTSAQTMWHKFKFK